jgi:DNA recombination-dependent growth factor C
VREQLDNQDDERAAFDQEFAVMSIELGKFLESLFAALGGIVED